MARDDQTDPENSQAATRVIGRPFQKGVSGNPGGRSRMHIVRDWLDQAVITGATETRREVYMQALLRTAMDRTHRDHVEACQILLAYDIGKPPQAIELSGPEGRPVRFDLAVLSIDELLTLRTIMSKAKDQQG